MHENPANQSLESEITRREFVASTLSAGFVLASSSLSAQSIRTDAEGILAGDTGIPAADGKTPAYRALPVSGESLPVVLVVCEIFGLQEHIKDICRRFAKEGYLAVAVEHFYRHGDVSKYGMDNFEEVIKIVSQTPDAEVMSDLDAAVACRWRAGVLAGEQTEQGRLPARRQSHDAHFHVEPPAMALFAPRAA